MTASPTSHVELPLQVPPVAAFKLSPSHSTPHEEAEPNVRIGDPGELISLLKARSAALIVGAGVSVALASGAEHKRLVTWRGFLDKLAETVALLLHLPPTWLEQIREHLSRATAGPSPAPDLQVAAELIAEKCAGKDPFLRYNHLVFKILHELRAEKDSMLAKSLDILGKRGDSPIMTTNYDVLLEDATGRFTLSIDDLLKCQRWHRVDAKTHPNPLDHHSQYIFHLHGLFYDDPDRKFVLTSREYAVTIDDFTIALKPVLIDSEASAPIVRSNIFMPGLVPSLGFTGAHAESTGRPRSRLSAYSTTDDGTVLEDPSPAALQAGMSSPKYRAHPHQLDHPRTRKERKSSIRSGSLGPSSTSPTISIGMGGEVPPLAPGAVGLSQTLPPPKRTVSPSLTPEHTHHTLPPHGRSSPSPSSPSSSFAAPGTGIGPSVAFHRSMIFIGVGGTLQDVHFTSLFAALQEHNVFLHHNFLERIKHYVLVKEEELDSVMDFVFLDSLGREVPARELLVAIVYGGSSMGFRSKECSELDFFPIQQEQVMKSYPFS